MTFSSPLVAIASTDQVILEDSQRIESDIVCDDSLEVEEVKSDSVFDENIDEPDSERIRSLLFETDGKWQVSYFDNVHAGTAKVTVTITETGEKIEKTFVIKKATPGITVSGGGTGTASNRPVIHVTVSGFGSDKLTGTAKYYKDAACTEETDIPSTVGTYYVKGYFAGNSDYNEVISSGTVKTAIIA